MKVLELEIELTDTSDKGGRLWFAEVPLSNPDSVLGRTSRTVADFVVLVQQLIVSEQEDQLVIYCFS